MRWTIKVKTIVGVAVIEMMLLTTLIITGLNYFRDYSAQRLQVDAELLGRLFAQASVDAVISYDLATLQSLIESLDGKVERLRVVDSNGNVLAQTGNFSNREFTTDTSPLVAEDNRYDFEVPIGTDGFQFAIAQISIDVSDFNNTLAQARSGALVIAITEVILVALFSYLLGSYITRQLTGLGRAAHAIKEGDYDIRIDGYRDDEVGDLSVAFNHMAQTLKLSKVKADQYQQQLEQNNQTLEARVQRRTASLEQVNQSLKQTAESLRNAHGLMARQEALATVGTLSAGMAHEINTPLGFIGSNTEVMRSYIEELKEAKELDADVLGDMENIVEENQQGIKRISDIIANLQTYVHDGAISFKMLALDRLVERALSLAKHRVPEKVAIDNKCVADCLVKGDETRLIQVITNLVVNAAQAIANQGVIAIFITRTESQWLLHVKDNGEGMSQEVQQRLFEPFFTTKDIGQGTGLGLSISYSIVQEHGGELQVKSEPGSGSCFTLCLPIAEGAERLESAVE